MAWDVRGKNVLVTGATSGIGLEASVELARRGARVVLVGRDPGRTEAALKDVIARSGSNEVSHLLCDFSSQADVRRLAESVLASHDRLDVLVNNAGGVNKTRRLTVDGIEATFAVNHLGYFLLTNLLTDLLVRSAPARVVTVASAGHRQGTLDFDDLGFERGYSILRAYTRSKLANVLFAAELARRLAGTGVTSNSLHPGTVATNIWSGAPTWSKPLIQLLLRPFFFLSAEEGGATIVQLAASPELEGVTGKYFERGKAVAPAPLARDEALARRLWDVSAGLVGL
ncbi:MAG TPA: SDR family oxidoreductase [Thermoanaerobaculia bacterium]|nr:SDR family oxidoreductase [Thermoanaerobaculia bacterium]